MPKSNQPEILSCSRFYFEIDGFTDLVVNKVSGISSTLQVTGDMKPMGVSKGGTAVMQATVTGVTNGKITIEFAASVEDNRLMEWYSQSHSKPSKGGGTGLGGEVRTGSLSVYNQGGEEAARWNMTGMMPASYKSSDLEAGSEQFLTETIEFIYESLHRVS
jgi:phage tail-like protein